jgi:hypothetical protein
LKISRLDLDGAGSPGGLVTPILSVERDLPIPVPVEALCERFDIISIGELETEGFEAALISDEAKSQGGILVAKGRSRQRRRFSIAHELGHFLIPAHRIPAGEALMCSAEHLRMMDLKDQQSRRRMEAEANRFAALLLMPPPMLRAELQKIRRPDITEVVRLAADFDVSKEAMARAYVDHCGEAVAIVVIRNGRVLRYYRNERHFPWIAVAPGTLVPEGCLWHERPLTTGELTQEIECEPELWLSAEASRGVVALTEQVLRQADGFSMLMLSAELRDDCEGWTGRSSRWRG